jgi:hypothetical protein
VGVRALPWNGSAWRAQVETDFYGIYIIVGVLGAVWLIFSA